MSTFNSSTLMGMRVVVSPLCVCNKISLSPECPVSEQFRQEFDLWLRSRFGTKDAAYTLADGTLVVGPAVYEKLKEASAERERSQ